MWKRAITLITTGVLGSLPLSVTAECVVLLHGLARSAASMTPMAEHLESSGFHVANIDYPSREQSIEQLAPRAIDDGIAACPSEGDIHFVTHSMGGILVRYYLGENELERLGKVVMLAPPNQGSEVVDVYGDVPGFEWINGPAGKQLGTGEDSLPSSLGPVDYDVGVIAGRKSINFLLSQSLPNPDDGKVSVEATKLEGMRDFLVVDEAHPFIMRDEDVMAQVVHFLKEGKFAHADESSPDDMHHSI